MSCKNPCRAFLASTKRATPPSPREPPRSTRRLTGLLAKRPLFRASIRPREYATARGRYLSRFSIVNAGANAPIGFFRRNVICLRANVVPREALRSGCFRGDRARGSPRPAPPAFVLRPSLGARTRDLRGTFTHRTRTRAFLAPEPRSPFLAPAPPSSARPAPLLGADVIPSAATSPSGRPPAVATLIHKSGTRDSGWTPS